MTSQYDLLRVDDFGELRNIMSSPFIGVQRQVIWWDLWRILYLKLSIALFEVEWNKFCGSYTIPVGRVSDIPPDWVPEHDNDERMISRHSTGECTYGASIPHHIRGDDPVSHVQQKRDLVAPSC